MAGLKRGNDAFGAAQIVKCRQRLRVGDAHILCAADVLEPSVFGTDAGVVQAGADAVRLGYLPVVVLQDIGAVAVQHARAAALQRRGVLAAVEPFARGLHANQARLRVRDVGMEDPHRVAAAAHAGEHRVGLACMTCLLREHLRHLLQAFLSDHALKVAHHHRVGMRSGHRSNDIKGVVDIGDPVAHGFVESVLERSAAAVDRHHGRAEQLHAVHIGALALNVFAAHIDHAFKPVARADRRGRDAVLASACLGDDSRLAHAPRQHRLPDRVVDFVRAGVIEVFAFQVDLGARLFAAHACGVVDRRRSADEVR